MFFPTSFRAINPSFDDVLSVRREMDRWFDRYVNGGSQSLQAWVPAADIRETENELLVAVELPGIRPGDVDVTVHSGVLTISGEKQWDGGSAAEGSLQLNERRYGRFERSFTLLQSVVSDDIRASFNNGVLTITLPKTAEAKPRRIQVEAADRVQVGAGQGKS